MPLEAAYAFDDTGKTLVRDCSGKERHLDLSTANASQVAGGRWGGGLGKTGATMPVLPAAVLAASQTDDRCIMCDYQADLTTWIIRFNDNTFGSGMFGLLNLGSPNAVQGQLRDNTTSKNLMTRPSATAPGAAWHHFALRYVRATGVATIFRDGVVAATQSFTAGTQLSTSADSIDLAEWTTAGPTVDNVRVFSHAPSDAEIAALSVAPVFPDSPIVIRTSGPFGPASFPRFASWTGVPADPPVTGGQNATLPVTGVANVGIAGTRDQPAALAALGVANVGLAGTRDQPATLPILGTANVGLAGTREQFATLPVTGVAAVGLAATRDQPASLPVTGAAAVTLAGVRDQPATLPVTGSAAVTLAALLDQQALLQPRGVAAVSLAGGVTAFGGLDVRGAAAVALAATREQPAQLAVTGVSALTLMGVRSTPAALAITGAASLTLDTLGTKTGDLSVLGTAAVALAGGRVAFGGLDSRGAAAVALGGTVTTLADWAATGRAVVQLLGTVTESGLLVITGTAVIGLIPEGADVPPGGLLIDVGEGRQVAWLVAGDPENEVVAVSGAPVPVSWLASGDGRPA